MHSLPFHLWMMIIKKSSELKRKEILKDILTQHLKRKFWTTEEKMWEDGMLKVTHSAPLPYSGTCCFQPLVRCKKMTCEILIPTDANLEVVRSFIYSRRGGGFVLF
jgi:hypothetical protein